MDDRLIKGTLLKVTLIYMGDDYQLKEMVCYKEIRTIHPRGHSKTIIYIDKKGHREQDDYMGYEYRHIKKYHISRERFRIDLCDFPVWSRIPGEETQVGEVELMTIEIIDSIPVSH